MSKATKLFDQFAVMNGLLMSMESKDFREAYELVNDRRQAYKSGSKQYNLLTSMVSMIDYAWTNQRLEEREEVQGTSTSPR